MLRKSSRVIPLTRLNQSIEEKELVYFISKREREDTIRKGVAKKENHPGSPGTQPNPKLENAVGPIRKKTPLHESSSSLSNKTSTKQQRTKQTDDQRS
jgi:hypothetical protein